MIALVALPLVLLGCSSGGSVTATPTGPGQTTAPTTSPAVTATGPATVVPTTPARPPGGSGATTAAGVPAAGSVTVLRTGGIAGVMQQVTIAPDGSWSYIDRRSGNTQQGKLTSAQRESLLRLAADPALAAESRAKPQAVCNDGFVYTISVGELSLKYDQCGGAAKHPVTAQLIAAVQDATPL